LESEGGVRTEVIMLQAEFVRDMHNNYIVIKGIEGKTTAYSTKMLLSNRIPGLLVTELRCINETDLYYYDITAKKSLWEFYENKALNYRELQNLLSSILSVFEESYKYLLSDNDFIIDPKYIFLDTQSMEIGLCHFPGYNENIQEQLSKLMEYLMNKTDYKDEAAVVLIYAMYKECKEPDCTFEALIKVLNRKEVKDKSEITDSQSSNKQMNSDSGNRNSEKLSDKSKASKVQDKDKQNNDISDIGNDSNTKTNKNRGKNIRRSRVIHGIRPLNQRLGHKKSKRKADKSSIGIRNKKEIRFLYKNIAEKFSGKNSKTNGEKIKEIPAEEIESEREFQYFSPATFVMAGISAVLGIVIFIGVLRFKLLHNAFGTHIDSTKLISFMLILGCTEAYIFIRLFDPKNKLIGIRTEVEELDANEDQLEVPYFKEFDSETNNPKEEVTELGAKTDPFSYQYKNKKEAKEGKSKKEIKAKVIYPDMEGTYDFTDKGFEYNNISSDSGYHGRQDKESIFNEIKPNALSEKEDPTQILWMDKNDSDQEATVILADLSPPKQYRLTRTIGEEKQEIPINRFPFLIGKGKKGVDFTIDDKTISRRHARFTKVGENVFLTDLNSTNGTYLNGVKLQENKPYLLTDKDIISFSHISYIWAEEMG
jgi:hypothetical protein